MTASALHFVVPGSLDTRTGGYRYDKRIIAGLRDSGHEVLVHGLVDRYPFPDAIARGEARHLLERLPDNARVIVDGLACGVLPEEIADHATRLDIIALVHHPLALETGLSKSEAEHLRQQETDALRHVSHVITTSATTTDSLSDYGVSADRITTVEPGTDVGPIAVGSLPEHFSILCIASLIPRKGYAVLVEALQKIQDLQPELAWHAHCVGSLERDPDTVAALRQQITDSGLEAYFSLHGEVGDEGLTRHYSQADIFTLPSFHEGYGMVLTEAIAHGLPIVSTTAGAIPDTVPAAAGRLVPPGDADALATALAALMTDKALYERLKHGACSARERLRSWDMATREFAEACTAR